MLQVSAPSLPDGPFTEQEKVTLRSWCRWRDMVRAEISRIWLEEASRMTPEERATFAKDAEETEQALRDTEAEIRRRGGPID